MSAPSANNTNSFMLPRPGANLIFLIQPLCVATALKWDKKYTFCETILFLLSEHVALKQNNENNGHTVILKLDIDAESEMGFIQRYSWMILKALMSISRWTCDMCTCMSMCVCVCVCVCVHMCVYACVHTCSNASMGTCTDTNRHTHICTNTDIQFW